MGTYAATGITTWCGGYDFTTDLNSLSMSIDVDVADDTRFGHTARARAATLEDVSSSLQGLWEAGVGKVDPEAFGKLTTAQPITHTPTGAAGDVAYFYNAATYSYQLGGKIGELLPFSLSAKGVRGNGSRSAGAIRGKLMAPKATVSATGVIGAGYQLGAVSASQFVYAAVHLFSAGSSITLVLESAAANTFSGATTRATIGPLTTAGGAWMPRVSGAITDTWWRIRASAVSGSHSIAAVCGIK